MGCASKILGPTGRLGRPLRVHGLHRLANRTLVLASAVGARVYFAAHPQDEWCGTFDIPPDDIRPESF